MLKRLFGWILLSGVALVGICSVLVHPFGNLRSQRSDGALLLDSSFDPQVMKILQTSCQNCHSEKTKWPWYSYLAPMSWMIERDVQRARSHMNLSHWNGYNPDQQEQILLKLAALVRNRAMPPLRYLLLHPGANLSDAEVAYLDQWARGEHKRLNATAPENTPKLRGSR